MYINNSLLKDISETMFQKNEITVRNNGAYYARCEVSYSVRGNIYTQYVNRIKEGETIHINIPQAARISEMKFEQLVFTQPEIWKTIDVVQQPLNHDWTFYFSGNFYCPKFACSIDKVEID